MFELLLAGDQPVTVAAVTELLGIPKSTAYELVRTLVEGGYIYRDRETGRLSLGRKLFELGMAYRSHVDLLKDGSRIVEELRDETGETVQLSVLENDMMMVLLKEEGVRPLRIISQVGSRVPVNWAAAGRLLVSDMDDKALAALLDGDDPAVPDWRAITDVKKLIAQIRQFRDRAMRTEINETNEHAGCVAAPVIDGSALRRRAQRRRARAAPGSPRPADYLIAAVRDAAQKLVARLGAR